MKKALFLQIAVACLLLFTGQALAATLFQEVGISSSPNPVGSGARAVGMGGAFIAVADDATAASWNPAGLIQLETPEVSAVGAYFNTSEDFTSDTHPEIANKGTSDGTNINYFSAAYPFRFMRRNIVVSLNYQRLYEFSRSFSHDLDYSDSNVDLLQNKDFTQDGNLGALGLASAVQITPGLSLGASINVWTDRLIWNNRWSENYSEHSTGTVGVTPVTIDTLITDSYSGFSGINANLGVLWDTGKDLTVGVVVKTPFTASLHHEFNSATTTKLGINDPVTNRQYIEEDVDLRMPLSYGIGIALRHSDSLSFAIDVYRTEWDGYVLTDSDGNDFSPIDGRPADDSSVRPTTQVRAGAEYLIIREETVVPLRAGLFYDPEPSHGSPDDFYGISLGSGIGYDKMIFDIAYSLRWGNNIDTGDLISTSRADIVQHNLLASAIFHF